MTKNKQKVDVDQLIMERLNIKDLDQATKDKALNKIGRTLQIEVGSRIVEQISEGQLAEFEKLADQGDDGAMQKWLADNVSNYGDIVVEELTKLLDDYDTAVDDIMNAK